MEKKQKVLIVDDEMINRHMMVRILGKKYEVVAVEGGKEALASLENDPDIHLVISDMNMPSMDGLEFIREAYKRFSNKKYFILSGYAITEETQKALDSKLICGYFQKPANFDYIDKVLKESV